MIRSQQPVKFAFKVTSYSLPPFTLVNNQKMAAFYPSFISDNFGRVRFALPLSCALLFPLGTKCGLIVLRHLLTAATTKMEFQKSSED